MSGSDRCRAVPPGPIPGPCPTSVPGTRRVPGGVQGVPLDTHSQTFDDSIHGGMPTHVSASLCPGSPCKEPWLLCCRCQTSRLGRKLAGCTLACHPVEITCPPNQSKKRGTVNYSLLHGFASSDLDWFSPYCRMLVKAPP